MKFLIFALAVACAHAQSDQEVPIVKSEYNIEPDGNFNYEYETGNGIYVQAKGELRTGPESEYPSLAMQGSYRYTSPEGEQIETSYVADEGGFQPQGSHIPQSPPIPEYITRSIEYIQAHPPPPPNNKF